MKKAIKVEHIFVTDDLIIKRGPVLRAEFENNITKWYSMTGREITEDISKYLEERYKNVF